MRWLLFFLLSGCCGPSLTVYTRYDTVSRLASTYVSTPDPRVLDPNTEGQSIIIHWVVPEPKDYHIEVTAVYPLREREVWWFPLSCKAGREVISVRGCDYVETGGYLSFQAVLYRNNEPIKIVTHPLFVERIRTRTNPLLERGAHDNSTLSKEQQCEDESE